MNSYEVQVTRLVVDRSRQSRVRHIFNLIAIELRKPTWNNSPKLGVLILIVAMTSQAASHPPIQPKSEALWVVLEFIQQDKKLMKLG